MLIAGDVGGTKTLLGLYDATSHRPHLQATHSYETNAFASFTAILDAFHRDVGRSIAVDAVAVGVAGPVVGDRASLTHITWDISAGEIRRTFPDARIALLNDLEAMAQSVEVLSADELEVLQEGTARPDGNLAIIAAGTGMGQAYIHRVKGKLLPLPSEGGHADYAPRTDEEIEFARMVRREHGRVSVEDAVSGVGLANFARFTHDGGHCSSTHGADALQQPAAISKAALAGSCPHCVRALGMFVSAYGAEAGNLALRGVATSGVFVGGGIAPKILPALRDGRFMQAFRDKGVMTELVTRMPVKVILNADAGLLGAAVAAQHL